MKRSQVSQVFIFALGIVILSMIMIFGYNVINELRIKGEEAAIINFKAKLASDVKITKDGDAYKKSYTIPSGYREVCFVDDPTGIIWHSEFHDEWGSAWLGKELELSNAIAGKVKDNVFLVGESKVDSLFIGDIDLGNCCNSDSSAPLGYINNPYSVNCFEIKNSKLNILLEGQGDNVLISRNNTQ